MTYKDAAFDRILDLEKSLRKMQKSIALTASKLTISRFHSNYRTYLLNIKLFNILSGQNYEPQIEELK